MELRAFVPGQFQVHPRECLLQPLARQLAALFQQGFVIKIVVSQRGQADNLRIGCSCLERQQEGKELPQEVSEVLLINVFLADDVEQRVENVADGISGPLLAEIRR